MRIQHWITAMGSSFVLLIAATYCHAQGGGGAVIVDGYAPPEASMGAPDGYGYQPPFNNYHPEVISPPNAPQMAPWPAISPFEPANVLQTQHVERDGNWFREMMFRNQQVTFSLEYVNTVFSNPGSTTVGSPIPPLVMNNNGLQIAGFPQSQFGEGFPAPTFGVPILVDRGVWPFPFRRTGAAATSTTVTTFGTVDAQVFPIRTTGDLLGKLQSDGIRTRFGMGNGDGTGWLATAYYAPGGTTHFRRGVDSINGVPITQAMIVLNPSILFTRNGAVPLDDGITQPPTALNSGFRGTTVKFDVLYEMANKIESAGIGLNSYMTPWIKGDSATITPFWGGRYMYIGEQFNFRGIDSGMSYTPTANTSRPTTVIRAYPLMEALLQNSVDSHLMGPQFGFKTELGESRAFRVWGETNFGLMINHERFNIEGQNIGDPLFHRDDPNINLGPDEMYDLANDRFRTEITSFSSTQTRTHLSPMFEQSVNAEMGFDGLFPNLAKSALLEDARLQVGYTMTAIAFASRASSSIAWRGFPLFHGIRTNHQSLLMHQFNVGLNWQY
ncbi:MAG: hypothetical protein R3C01_18560 [Planctomycetaceae bacterium]